MKASFPRRTCPASSGTPRLQARAAPSVFSAASAGDTARGACRQGGAPVAHSRYGSTTVSGPPTAGPSLQCPVPLKSRIGLALRRGVVGVVRGGGLRRAEDRRSRSGRPTTDAPRPRAGPGGPGAAGGRRRVAGSCRPPPTAGRVGTSPPGRRRGRFPERHRARPRRRAAAGRGADGPRRGRPPRRRRDAGGRARGGGPAGAPARRPGVRARAGTRRAASGGRSGPGPAFGEPPGSARAGRPSGRSAGVVGPCTGPPEDAVVFGVGGKSRRRRCPAGPGGARATASATASPARPPRRRRPGGHGVAGLSGASDVAAGEAAGRCRRRGGRPVPPPPPRRGVPGVPAADREGRRRPEGARVRPVPDDDPQDAGRRTLSGPPAALARAFPADRRRPARSGRALLRRDHRRVRPPRRLRERAAAGALGPRLPDPPRRRHHPRPRRPTMPTDQRDRALEARSASERFPVRGRLPAGMTDISSLEIRVSKRCRLRFP